MQPADDLFDDPPAEPVPDTGSDTPMPKGVDFAPPLADGQLAPWIGSAIAAPGLTVIEPIAAPALNLPERLSKPSSLQAFQGKVVLVNFWATYCKPCSEEMPSLDQLRQRLAAKGFELIGVDLADGPEAVTRFLATTPVNFPILFDP